MQAFQPQRKRRLSIFQQHGALAPQSLDVMMGRGEEPRGMSLAGMLVLGASFKVPTAMASLGG